MHGLHRLLRFFGHCRRLSESRRLQGASISNYRQLRHSGPSGLFAGVMVEALAFCDLGFICQDFVQRLTWFSHAGRASCAAAPSTPHLVTGYRRLFGQRKLPHVMNDRSVKARESVNMLTSIIKCSLALISGKTQVA